MAGTRSRHGVAPLLSLSPMLTLLICPSVDAVVYQGSGNRCSAWYRGHCPNPNDLSVIGFHVSVGTLKDCMTYCYQAFVYGGPPCAFGVFLGTLQSDNCLIINAGGQTTMEDYLDQCSNKRDSLLRKPASGQMIPRRVQKLWIYTKKMGAIGLGAIKARIRRPCNLTVAISELGPQKG